ncbi:VIT and vWA domain-containing protein [Thauera sp. SWB20]|uniref:VIT and vWA domain-containing protein n=1 Tax=Thauera sp. SWB20 TaxID=1572758 RepID=UPI0005ADCD7B|nr:VIT and VWA domain-containing protein [Thauera sp. SWB20]KIN88937.1 von Willebrand factor type A domain protein [Thauera sp. SWB20]KIN90278.1 von Willebrand factor type A domain protein [Thauera sp. SWB20]
MMQQQSARLESRAGEALTLKGVRFEGSLRGTLFEANLEQRFANPFDRHVELVYTFPLPWAAVLLGVEVQIGDRRLSGAVVEKKQAEQGYEDAIAEGNTAILLEQNFDDSYTLNLGNLAPGETCVVRLRYAQVVQFEQHGLRLVVPTVIAPRYGDPVADAGLKPHQVVEHDLMVSYPFELSLRVEGALARARIGSPSHPLSMRLEGEGETTAMVVSLARGGRLDRDFILVLDEVVQDSLALCAQDTVQPGAVSVLASFCPRVPASAHPLAVKILVDCSGSMQGDSIAAARRALQAIVAGLREGERFSLSRFGSTVEHRSRALWRTSPATRLAGQRWAAQLQADLGGTEMEKALDSTLALAGDASVSPGAGEGAAPVDLLLITDGQIHAIERTVAKARALGHRVFVVGIGSAPAEGVLRRLADETGGACDFVAPGEAVEPAVLRMFARLRSQRMASLDLVWPAGAKPVWMSALPGSVFDGDAVTVWARFAQVPDGTVRLVGTRAHAEAPESLGEASLTAAEHDSALSRMAVAAQIETLLAAEVAHSRQALELAVAYQLVSPLTHFLLVETRAEADKPADMPDLVKVPSMLPAGFGGLGSLDFCVDPCMAPLTVNEAPEHYGSPAAVSGAYFDFEDAFDAPVVLRSGRRSDRRDTLKKAGNYDIPAFLRRGSNQDARQPPRDDPRYWRAEPHYTGLTPLGLTQWLHSHPQAEWPQSYAELSRIGVGPAVLDWLKFVLAEGEGEALVVASFIQAMAQRDLHEALLSDTGTLGQLKALAKRVAPGATLKVMQDDPAAEPIVARLQVFVCTLRAERWPNCVFDLRDEVTALG